MCVGGGVLLTYMYIYVSDYIYTIILHNIFFFSCIYLLLCKLHVLCSLVGRVIMYVVYYNQTSILYKRNQRKQIYS